MTVRTRFAPSPTGFLHVGGIRTALFAWLVARQAGGQFVLRLEDTDKAREVAGSDKHIVDSLHWLGLEWDEGFDKGGPLGPYRQSERLATYKQWGQKLVDSGRAYADPHSPKKLEELRQLAKKEKRAFSYRDHRPENPSTWDGTQPLRFKSDPKAHAWTDAVMGKLSSGPEAIDDFILIKADGYPTYNFAHIIDDHLMEITHVIRSQEFVSSIPRFLNLYEALGFDAPVLATLPYVMGPDGTKKLSKRDGAKDVLDYSRDGYLPEALMSFLATLGWNDGTTKEIFSKQELLEKFSLDRVQRSGARFDDKRLTWINGSLIRNLTSDELYERAQGFWPPQAHSANEHYKRAVLKLVQERLKYFSELPGLTNFFFEDLPVNLTLIHINKQLNTLGADKLTELLEQATSVLQNSTFEVVDLSEELNKLLQASGTKPAVLFGLIRIAITQVPASPGLADTLQVLGKSRSLERIKRTIEALRNEA